jgi:hypothetical protein
MNLVDQVLKVIGEYAVVGGGAAAVAFALFRLLGKTWIEGKFAERLETFKHQQALELQRLRIEIESMLSGALKLQELEFEILPEAWRRLDDAFGLARWITSGQQQYEGVEKATGAEFEEVLKKTLPDLMESQRASLIESNPRDRQSQYQKFVAWRRYKLALRAANELDSYIASKGLFLPSPLKEQFREIVPIIRRSLISVETSMEVDDYKMRRGAGDEMANAEPLVKGIERGIESRLQSHARRLESPT